MFFWSHAYKIEVMKDARVTKLWSRVLALPWWGTFLFAVFVVSVSGPAVVGGVCWAGPGFRVGAR